jgi:hypothetical protein
MSLAHFTTIICNIDNYIDLVIFTRVIYFFIQIQSFIVKIK